MLALHDGPELAQLAAVTQFSAAMIALGRLPAHRLALAFARSTGTAGTPPRLPMPTRCTGPCYRPCATSSESGPRRSSPESASARSAALHAATTFPGTWAALFLQSGSFFRRESDVQESSFVGFDAITRYVQSLDDATEPTQRSGYRHDGWSG